MTNRFPFQRRHCCCAGFESFKVKLIVADDYAKYSTDFPILENIENREYYGRSASQIKGEIPIQIHSASTIEGKTAILQTLNRD